MDNFNSQHSGPEMVLPSVIAESTEPLNSKRSREPSHEGEDAVAALRLKRPRIDMTEFGLVENPSYIRTMEIYGEKLQEHIERVGGWQGLPDIDRGRYRYLTEACTKRDGFYLVIHQLFCAWTEQASTVHQLLAPVSADKVDKAFEDLQQVLLRNESLQENHWRHFVNWPRRLEDLDLRRSTKGFYQRHLPQVRDFVERFVEKWSTLLTIVTRRGFPIMTRELIFTLGCWSDVMRYVLFTISRRKLGVKDQHATQINALRVQDQRSEIDVLKGNISEDDVDRNRPNFRARYQAATSDARRRAQHSGMFIGPTCLAAVLTYLKESSYELSSSTPGSTPIPSTSSASCLETARTAFAMGTTNQAQSTNTADQANQHQATNTMATNYQGTVRTAARIGINTPSLRPMATDVPTEQQPGTEATGTQQPAATTEQGSQVAAAEDLVARLERTSANDTSATRSEQAGPGAQTVASRRNVSTPPLQGHGEMRPEFVWRSHLPQQAFQLTDPLTNVQASRYQSQMQHQGSSNQLSPPLPSAQAPQYQGQMQWPDFVPTMAQAPQFQAQAHQRQVASPHPATQQRLSPNQQNPCSPHVLNHPIEPNNQLQHGLGQGYMTPHFSSNSRGQGNQSPVAGSQAMQASQLSYHQKHAETQRPQQQYYLHPQMFQAALYQQTSPTYALSPQGGSPALHQTMVATSMRGHTQQRPQGQARGRTQFAGRFKLGPTVRVQRTDAPGSPHDLVSAHLASHLPRMRSPLRKPVNGAAGRHYQFVNGFAAKPQKIHPDYGVRTMSFDIPKETLERIPARMRDAAGSSVRPYFEGAVRLRLRCCQQPDEADLTESRWVTYPTAWPSEVYLCLNNSHLDVPRKHHFKHDLPIELSDALILGLNELKIVLPRKSAPVKGTFFFAVEAVCVWSHQRLLDLCGSNTIAADQMKAKIAKRLSPGPDDDIQMETMTGLTISLTDPWTSVMFGVPVRGVNCRHLECLDLRTLLTTRPSKPTIDRVNLEPSMVDVWKCPTCDEDIRPTSLGIDMFMYNVRQTLVAQGKGNTKAIIAQADGSWTAVEEPDDEDEDGPPPANRAQSTHSATNKPPPEIIEIDSD